MYVEGEGREGGGRRYGSHQWLNRIFGRIVRQYVGYSVMSECVGNDNLFMGTSRCIMP